MSFEILEKSANHILYEMIPGKPNPLETKIEGRDQRGRVYQSKLKGPTCTYYTFNYLRQRIGKEFDPSFQRQREIEVICSERRKKITNLYVHRGEKPNPEQIVKYEKIKEAYETSKKEVPFFDFLKSMEHIDLLEIDTQFLYSMKIGREVVDGILEIMKGSCNNVLECYGSLLNGYANHIEAKAYGLLEADWTPQSKIEELIAELKTGGPMAIGGSIGMSRYQEEPRVMKQKVKERKVYYWPPGSPKTNESDLHIILVIGAKKHEGKGYVYYIDCNDPSNPENKETQKIYITSYANLCENATTIMALKTPEKKGLRLFPYGYQANLQPHR